MSGSISGSIAAQGLSQAEAERLQVQFGSNSLPPAAVEWWGLRFLRQFRSPLIYILLLALLLETVVWFGERGPTPWEALAIAVILVLNATLGFWQERKAEHALRELNRLAAPRAWVVRDGRIIRLPSSQLVPGDLVRMEAGDRIPTDAALVDPASLLVDESILTGESLPAEKTGGSEIFAGTLAVRGMAYARVTRTGRDSAMGRLVSDLARVRPEPTPLERRIDAFGRQIARWVLLLSAAIAAVGLAVEGRGEWSRVLLFAVALAVAAVPEGLPAILTLALTRGVQRMARRNALVRKLTAVESLGSVTVIATDKTGTLTENQLEVRQLDSPDPDRALRAMALANDADPASGAGDPLEVALLMYARSSGTGSVSHPWSLVSRRAFDSASRFMRVTVQETGQLVSYLKGAPEVLLDRSTLDPSQRQWWHTRIDRAAAEGYRLIGFAWAADEREHNLEWLGLALLWDPPRPEVKDALRQAREAGIRIVMVTGDHGATAMAVAAALGLEAARVMTGDQLEALASDGRHTAARETNIFARVNPGQKLAIVEALKATGEIVAVTGDGVNDAPALKRADVGVAMGRRGSDVAREVADLILLDDNFATIVAAIEEGRSIYANIQKFIRFLFSTNLSEVVVVLAGMIAAVALDLRESSGALLVPLTAAQLLWINLVTDGVPALALTADRNPGLMRAPPRPPDSPLLDRASLWFIGAGGGAKAIVVLALLAALPLLGTSRETARTAIFALLACGQLLFVYPVRRIEHRPLPNWLLHVAIVGGFLVQVAVVQLPVLARTFHAAPLSLAVWLAVAGASILAWVLAEIIALLLRRPRFKTLP